MGRGVGRACLKGQLVFCAPSLDCEIVICTVVSCGVIVVLLCRMMRMR